MKLPFISPNNQLVGIDIQPHALHLVQLTKTKQHHRIDKIAIRPLPPDTFAEGKIKNWTIITEIVKELVALYALQHLPAAICLPAAQVIMQHMQLPAELENIEIEAEVFSQIKQDLPGLNDSVALDFIKLTSHDTKFTDVFYIVAREAYIKQYVACINSTGLTVKIVDIDIYALKRVCHYPNLLAPDRIYGTVIINKQEAIVLIFDHQLIHFHQTWEISSVDDFFTQLTGRLTCTDKKLDELSVVGLPIVQQEKFPLLKPIEPLACFELNPDIDADYFSHHALDLLLATGAALRQAPAW